MSGGITPSQFYTVMLVSSVSMSVSHHIFGNDISDTVWVLLLFTLALGMLINHHAEELKRE